MGEVVEASTGELHRGECLEEAQCGNLLEPINGVAEPIAGVAQTSVVVEQFELGEVVSRHHLCFCLRREQPRQPTISADERLLEKIHDAVVTGTLDPT
ncbi:hypothetical protein [Burkholderia cepacia]|uniref:hypothetical protein n=1 Tax=Burkholderia cepacia TaxID=292 RepID=UPI0015923EEE|nr:hypothetical protein [Burkholderia cepacia]